MVDSETVDGVLLPFDTLVLLGAGTQGAAAIRNYGIGARDFEQDFVQLVERLDAAGGAEAEVEARLSRAIAATSAQAHAWISLRSESSKIAPAVLLVGEEVVLIVVLHGPVVEYAIGEHALASRAIRGALEMDADAVLRITLFDMDEGIVGARLAHGSVEVAAKDRQQLERLERSIQAVPGGPDALSAALIREALCADDALQVPRAVEVVAER